MCCVCVTPGDVGAASAFWNDDGALVIDVRKLAGGDVRITRFIDEDTGELVEESLHLPSQTARRKPVSFSENTSRFLLCLFAAVVAVVGLVLTFGLFCTLTGLSRSRTMGRIAAAAAAARGRAATNDPLLASLILYGRPS